jgi:hypothetical protein
VFDDETVKLVSEWTLPRALALQRFRAALARRKLAVV